MRITFKYIQLAVIVVCLTSACRKSTPEAVSATPAEASAPKESRPAITASSITLSPESIKLAGIEVSEAADREISAPLAVSARIVVNEDLSTRVGSLFSGRILEAGPKVGDRVSKGQALARMHTHEVHEAQAEFEKAQAELTQRRNLAEYTRNIRERAERLFNAKAGSRNELDKAIVDHQAALLDVKRAEAELERANGHREHLGLPNTLNYDEPVVIAAPASGIVMKREITPGSSVNPGDNLFIISDLSSIWAIAEVLEKDLPSVRIGAPVKLSVAAYPGVVFNGRVSRIGEALNPQTRTAEVRCSFDNRQGKLKPEMYATATLETSSATKRMALVVAESAIQDIDGQAVVFVALPDHKFEKRSVRTDHRENGVIEILSGLTRGEKIVTKGSFQLKSEFLKDRMNAE